jgi:hypothetical protein
MYDTLRHVHTDLSTTTCAQTSDSPKKRSHSVETDEPDDEQEPDWHCPNKSPSRPIKPLKFSKSSFVRTPSLPTGSSAANPEIVEEEDWSLTMCPETAEQQFEAMEL